MPVRHIVGVAVLHGVYELLRPHKPVDQTENVTLPFVGFFDEWCHPACNPLESIMRWNHNEDTMG